MAVGHVRLRGAAELHEMCIVPMKDKKSEPGVLHPSEIPCIPTADGPVAQLARALDF